MKKKIKDITVFEISDLCLKNSACELCPLHISDPNINYECVISLLDRGILFNHEIAAKVLEREVEI